VVLASAADLLDAAPIDAGTWSKILTATAVTWAVVETEKAITRRIARRQPRGGFATHPAHRET
jgi:hypothetical protein